MSSIQASPAKLRDGTWGARVRSESVTVGDTITITTRAGKSWDATVSQLLWTGDGVAICTTQNLDQPTPRKRGGCSCDCDDCRPYCRCDAHCVCRGGNIYDC